MSFFFISQYWGHHVAAYTVVGNVHPPGNVYVDNIVFYR